MSMQGFTYAIAIDDGYFPMHYKSRRGYTVLVAVKYSLSEYRIVGIAWNYILVDGLDGTEKAIELIKILDPRDSFTIYDGVTYAGFNVIDPFKVLETINVPGIVFYRYPLDLERIRRALEKHFRSDYIHRLKPIEECLSRKYYMSTRWRIVEYTPIGLDPLTASDLLSRLQIYSPEPEPLRISDMLASKLSRILLSLNTL